MKGAGPKEPSFQIDHAALRSVQIHQLYYQASAPLYGVLIASIILITALWNVVSHTRLVAWFCCSAALYTARHLLVIAFRRASPSGEAAINRWGTWFYLTSCVSGLLWGTAAVFLFPTESPLHQAALVILIGGICSGTAVVYSPAREAYLPFTLLAGLPMAGVFFYRGGHVNAEIGAIILVYVAVVIVAANRMHAVNTESLKLRFENRDLIRVLKAEKERADTINEELRSEIRERMKTEEQLASSLKEKEVLLREIHHRVKNNLQVMSSLLSLQSEDVHEKRYLDMFNDAETRIRSMALVHERLYRSENLKDFRAKGYIEDIVHNLFLSSAVSRDRISVTTNVEDAVLDIDAAVTCGLIISELVSNSFKHAFPEDREGEVTVSLHRRDKDGFELTIQDNGVGIPPEIDFERSDTLGLQLVKMFGEQLGAQVELIRTEGTRFDIRFNDPKTG